MADADAARQKTGRRVCIEAYRAALAKYRDRDLEVVFPLGTWLMR